MKNIFFFSAFVLFLFACGGNSSSDVANSSPGVQTLDLTGFSIVDLPGGFQQVTRSNAEGKIIEEGVIKNRKRNGTWVTYQDKRNLPKSVANFIDDVYNGVYMEYSNSGQLELICRYKNNVLQGQYLMIKNTRMQEKRMYVDGQIDGLYQKFYPNKENIQQENNYKMGKLHGESKYYNEKGQLTMEYKYENGDKISGGMVEPQEVPVEQ